MSTSTAGYLIAGLAAALLAIPLLMPPARDPATHPYFQDARNIDSELRRARTATTFRGVPATSYLTPANSLFRDCFPAVDNQPADAASMSPDMPPDGLADNLDPRRIPWPPLRPGETRDSAFLAANPDYTPPDTAALARYERRFCDQRRP